MAVISINTRDSITYLQSEGTKLKSEFQKEMIKRTRDLAAKMQRDLAASIDKGGVSFTNKSILFTYKRKSDTNLTASILVKNVQAKYLYDIIVKPKAIDKLINTSAAKLTKQGNISGLHANLQSGKYKIVKSKNGKERLIDTSKKDTKKKTKRVIAVRENKRRKLIYDFYEQAETGFILAINDIGGTFKITKG